MTNEEEKILEEEDITLEDAAEEAEELQEETQDEGRAIEIPIERREEIQERQVLRDGGLRDADTNMIHTHLDNFLAKIAGETPVDDNVRNSTEYWLNKIAEFAQGGSTENASTKKIYWHTVSFIRSNPNSGYDDGYLIILTNSADPITLDVFLNLLKTPGFVGIVINGRTSGDTALPNPPTGADYTLCTLYYVSDVAYGLTYRKADNTIGDFPGRSISNFTVTDLGANAIN